LNGIKWFAVDIDGTITLNGNGMVNLNALSKLRYLVKLGYKVIYVTGRSSIEAFALAVFGGTTHISIGENGGVISTAPNTHRILADKKKCLEGYDILRKEINHVSQKPVFPRMSEVVLERTFSLEQGNQVLQDNGYNLILVDSNYAYHLNEVSINKGFGLETLMNLLRIHHDEVVSIGDSITDIPMFDKAKYSITFENSSQDVRRRATHIVNGENGEGLVNAIDLVIEKKLNSEFI
jgi:phosphoglycolate phosphatase (TIGR01487 family)